MIKFISHPTLRTLQMQMDHKIHFQRITEVSSFMYGIEIITEEIEDIISTINIDHPTMTSEAFIGGEMFTFIHPKDIDFWGIGGLQHFLQRLEESRPQRLSLVGSDLFFDNNGEAICPLIIFSKSELKSINKTLVAHIMETLGIFKSVGEAKRNGWDKPIEIGKFCVTKKKINFEVIE